MWKALFMEHNVLLLCHKRSLKSRENLLWLDDWVKQGEARISNTALLPGALSQLTKGGSVFPQRLRLRDD